MKDRFWNAALLLEHGHIRYPQAHFVPSLVCSSADQEDCLSERDFWTGALTSALLKQQTRMGF